LYELRDNRAGTIDYKYFYNNSDYFTTFKIDFEKYKSQIDYLEIFLFDLLGNIKKFQLY
jgi:hypothetical protein